MKEAKVLTVQNLGFYFFGKEYPLVRIDGHVFLRTNLVSCKLPAISVH